MNSSFRNQRVVIASLFLPTTAVLGESAPPSPGQPNPPLPGLAIPASAFRLPDKTKQPTGTETSRPHTPKPSISGPPRSIVDDLKDKVIFTHISKGFFCSVLQKSRIATPAAQSPANEKTNPFATLAGLTLGTGLVPPNGGESKTPNSPPISFKRYLTADSSPRIQRKSSRSSSRRPDSESKSPLTQNWHIESNPNCNGGLKNAVDSVSQKLKKKLWVGTLGTSTDRLGEELRSDIDTQMLNRGSLPIWIPDAEFESCYDEFCHQVRLRWPLTCAEPR